MKDYSDIGLNPRLRSMTGLGRRAIGVPAIEFDGLYEVQTSRLNASKVNLGELVKRAGTASAVGTLSTSQALNLTTTITYKTPKASKKTFGHPLVSIYQGTTVSAANQIFPIRGTAVTLGRYDIQGGFDYQSYDGTADTWRALLTDTNGTSTQEITFVADWLYVDYATEDTA